MSGVSHMALLAGLAAGSTGITFVGSDSSSEGSNRDTINLTLPVGHQADDFAIVTSAVANTSNNMDVITALGYTLLYNEESTNGQVMEHWLWYKKLTSGSEVNPSVSMSGFNREHHATLHVFRGVDTTTPFDAVVEYAFDDLENTPNPTNPAITTVTPNAAIFLIHNPSHNGISVAGTPSGYVLSENEVGINHREYFTAYLLDAGAAGVKSPPIWGHTTTDSSPDGAAITLALRPA